LLRLIGYDKILGWVSPAILRGQTLETVGEKPGSEAVELARQGRAVLVDVRGRTEYADVRLEPSRNIPLGELLVTGQSLSPDDEIIVTCAGGARSPIAVSLLRRMGFRRVSNLSGGVSGCPSDLCATR
jgi:rhodanese-related sulfurtransferase